MTEGGLRFEVIPESCLRNEHIELMLGVPINQVISALQNCSKLIKNVQLIYDNKNPFDRDITITLKNDGIRLYFEPYLQILKLIEVFDFKNITLHYGDTTFSTPSEEANVSKVENCFGATHPGVYDEGQRMYRLHWRGVSFSFPAKEPSSTVQPRYAHGLGSLNFANSSLPLLERMTIFSGNSPNETSKYGWELVFGNILDGNDLEEYRIPDVPVSCLCGDIYLNNVKSIVNERGRIAGLQISFRSENLNNVVSAHKVSELESVERIVRFGDSEESVMSALGAPSKIYYKSDEKMLIQRGSSSENFRNVDKPDFFYNYFQLGMDILFDYETRRVLKFILHTNIPGHFDFAIYSRCYFTITVERNVERCDNGLMDTTVATLGGTNKQQITIETKSKLESFSALFPSQNAYADEFCRNNENVGNTDNTDSDNNFANAAVRRNRKTSAANQSSNDNGESLMSGNKSSIILNKCSSLAGALDGSENPFGSTFCYGTDQIIVEVMDNSQVASVILYE